MVIWALHERGLFGGLVEGSDNLWCGQATESSVDADLHGLSRPVIAPSIHADLHSCAGEQSSSPQQLASLSGWEVTVASTAPFLPQLCCLLCLAS